MRPAVMLLFALASSGCIIETVEHGRDGSASDAGSDASADAMPDAADTGVPDSGIDASPCARCGECELCTADACVPAPDGTTCTDGSCHEGACCTGCWDSTACQRGDTDFVCGAGGAACGSCGCPGDDCIDGHCTLPTGVICPRLTWALGFGATATGVGTDASDNIYATGYTESPIVELGAGPVRPRISAAIWTASYRAGGEHRRSSILDLRDDDLAKGLVVDPLTGATYVVGEVAGDYDFGGGLGTTPLDSTVAFIAAFDASGAYRWSHVADTTNIGTFHPLLFMGDLYAATTLAAGTTVDFGCGPRSAAAASSVLFARFNSETGSCESMHVVGEGTGRVMVGDLSRSESGFFIVGGMSGRVTLGSVLLGSDVANEVFLLTLDEAGGVVTSQSFHRPVPATYSGQAIAAVPDGSGGMYVAGTFSGSVDFAGSELTSTALDGFVLRWRAGAVAWARRLGGPADDAVQGLAATSAGVVATGTFRDTADFGNGPMTAAGPNEGFVAELGRGDGLARWSQAVGGGGPDSSFALALLSDGSFVVGGAYTVGSRFPDGAVLFRLVP